MDKYKFGEFLYKKRKSLGLTQDELGRKLGVTNKAVSKWEVGETFPDITMLKPLSDILGLSVDELLNQKENNVIEKKKRKTNLILIIIIIILAFLEILTIISFSTALIVKSVVSKTNKNEIILITQDNYDEYLTMIPMKNFISEGQNLIIESHCQLDSSYIIKENIEMIIVYEIDVFYYLANNEIGGISYYNRQLDVVMSPDKSFGDVSIVLSPNETIDGLRGIKSIVINYKVISCNGSIEKNE